jgi:uncharacterized protein (TIGR03437 family)
MRRLVQLLVLLALAAGSAAGYYHFVHYASPTGPFTPIYEKFDLSALLNRTLYFYVSEERPALAASDSYESLIGQVRQALAAWNAVPTSELRVAYGGVATLDGLEVNTPVGEIVFEELAPGVLGLGGPTSRLPEANGFIPIIRSRLLLPRDLTNTSRTTASESFFNSLVHEIGHTLGLQHSMTGAAMSMEVVRSTSRAQPLAADDVAGLSLLYPAPGFQAATGVIAGRVTGTNGQGLNLISVVAASPSGAVVSALTAPDGSYRIEGLPAASYLVYAHPLPPASTAGLGPANLVLPTSTAGGVFEASGPVETLFYGGVRDPNLSTPVQVQAGAASEGVDFRLASRPGLSLYDVTTYSFPGNGAPAILPAFLNIAPGSGTVLAFGPGLSGSIGSVTVGILGGGVQVRPPSPYGPDPRFAEIPLDFNPFTGTGPRHLVFSLNGDIYIRPAGVRLVAGPAPLVREVQVESESAGRAVLVLSGDNFQPDSRIYVDGLPAERLGFDGESLRWRVLTPPGAGGRAAVITIYNPDGQSSVFVQPSAPATYTYPPATGPPSVAPTPRSAPAGRDVMIQIDGVDTNFAEGQTVVGFGTSDVVTRQVWVLSPTRLLAVASVSAHALPASTTVSVSSGLQVVTLPDGFQIDPPAASGSAPILGYQGLVNSATSSPRVAPGSLASLFGANLTLNAPASAAAPLPSTLAGTTVTINDQPVPLLLVTPTQINLQLPFTLSAGPAILRVNNGAAVSAPMVVQIDALAPGLFRILNAAGAVVNTDNPARPGDTLVLFGTGLGPVIPPATAGLAAPLANASSTVRVHLNGTELTPFFAGLAPGTTGLYQVNVQLPPNLPPVAAVGVYVTVDGQTSNRLPIAVR